MAETQKTILGPVGETLMRNIKRIREKQQLTYVELASRLASIERPIPVLGLRRIERGERRVDVDDLIALAIVLDVSPNALLLPQLRDAGEVDLTTSSRIPTVDAWRWATGDKPFPKPEHDREMSIQEWMEIRHEIRARFDRFILENRPHDPQRDMDFSPYAIEHRVAFDSLAQAVLALRAEGVPLDPIVGYVEAFRESNAKQPDQDQEEDRR